MARLQLQNGSQGSDVEYLQQFLNTQGYKLTVDGIFGNNTLAAVKDFQGKNNLTVDGIVGNKTWGAIDKLSASAGAGTGTTTPKAFNYGDYKESSTVTAAGKSATAAADAVKNYGDFSYGNQAAFDDIISRILGREEFSYDLNGDALYQQYKDRYMQQGKMAMQDTMGQAAAMTGGYGNSYAATAGNQAYQAHLEGLNDVVPQLYQMAFDRYNQEGQDMLSQYGVLADDRSREYSEWQAGLDRAIADRDYTKGVYDSERSYDYSKWVDGRDFAYGEHRDAISDQQWQAAMEYQKERDRITDEQWQKTYDAVYGNSGETGGGGGDDTPDTTPKYSTKNVNDFISKIYPEEYHDAIARKVYGPYRAYVAVQIAQDSALSDADKIYLIQHYGITESDLQYARDKGYNV